MRGEGEEEKGREGKRETKKSRRYEEKSRKNMTAICILRMEGTVPGGQYATVQPLNITPGSGEMTQKAGTN